MKRGSPKQKLLASVAAVAISLAGGVFADAEKYELDIKQQEVGLALVELGAATGVQMIVPQNLGTGARFTGLKGEYTLAAALDQILNRSGLTYEFASENEVVIRKTDASGKGPRFISDDKEKFVEEMIVTAQRREQRLQDVPMSISARTGEDLEVAGVGDLQSLSLSVPGVTVIDSGTNSRLITIRGVANGNGASPLVGIYLDEAIASTNAYNVIDLRVHDIERVEVLKGPQGTLYGEGSVGGTVRFVTKDPVLNSFEGNASADTSFTQSGDASHELKGVINAPLVEDRLGLRLVGQYVNAGGWIDQPARELTDINGYELSNIRSKLLWRPADNLDIEAMAIVHRNDRGAENVGEDENGNFRQKLDGDSTASGQDDYNLYNIFANYDIGNIDLISSTTYVDSYKSQKNRSGQCCGYDTSGNLFEFLDQPDGITEFTTEALTQEIRLTLDDTGPFHGHLGFIYREFEYHTAVSGLLFGARGGTVGVDIFELSGFSEQRSKSWAVFSEASYEIIDSLEVGAGFRYYEDKRRERFAITEAALPSTPFEEATFDNLSPRFFVSYGITENMRLYANVAEGFRSGGFNAAGQPPFSPESLWSYEVGTKLSALDGLLNVEIALFQSDYDDYVVYGLDLDISAFGLNSNAGKARIRGVDASVIFRPTADLELGFTSNYTDAEFTEINVASSSYVVGDPIDQVPAYQFSIWGDYSFSWPDGRPGFARLDYSHRDRSYFRNRQFGPGYTSTSNIVSMLNGRLGWRHENWSTELYAINLLNERGFITANTVEAFAVRPQPRTIGIHIGVDF